MRKTSCSVGVPEDSKTPFTPDEREKIPKLATQACFEELSSFAFPCWKGPDGKRNGSDSPVLLSLSLTIFIYMFGRTNSYLERHYPTLRSTWLVAMPPPIQHVDSGE